MPINLLDLSKLWGRPFQTGSHELIEALGPVSTDSRTLKQGDFFIPLIGENYDGHKFLNQAHKKGAQGALVSKFNKYPVPKGLLFWYVEDTLLSYQELALIYRNLLHLPFIGVTGSSGKTTTRELIAALLRSKGPVATSQDNENNDIGVAKSILNVKDSDSAAVIEMGMRALGEISRLSRVAKPDIAVVTNVGSAHLGCLGSLDNIAKAKCEITSHLNPNGVVVIPFGSKRLEQALAENWRGRVIRVYIESDSTYYSNSCTDVPPEFRPDIIGRFDSEDSSIHVDGIKYILPLEGFHNAQNFLLALAVSKELDCHFENGHRVRLELPKGRSGFLSIGNLNIMDETYNASPEAVIASLKLLMTKRGRHFAVLGEMLELGEHSLDLHIRVIKEAVDSGITGLILVLESLDPDLIKDYVSHLPFSAIVSTPEEAIVPLVSWTQPGDFVLLKGSRAIGIERMIPLL